MDPLSDLLRVVRLDGAYFYTVEAAEPWSAETVAARELSPRIMPTAEHLISYHILTEGRCYGGIVGEQQVERSEEHTSELQSPCNLVCRLLLEKKKKENIQHI